MSRVADEMTPLVGGTWLVHSKSVLSKYSKKVFVNSKAAVVILLWNFAINYVYGSMFAPRVYIQNSTYVGSYAASFVIAIVLVLSPVAGSLADVKLGRYKTLQYSMWLILAVSSLFVFASLIIFINDNISTIQVLYLLLAFSIPYLLGYTVDILQISFNTDWINFVMLYLKI